MKKITLLITLLTSFNLYSQDAMSNYMDIMNNSMQISDNRMMAEAENHALETNIITAYTDADAALTAAYTAADAQIQSSIDALTASLNSMQSSVQTNAASINDIVVNTSIPSNAVVIPTDATGPVQIILESSQDMINWNAANPGTYGATVSDRFYRVRAVQQ